MNPDTMEFKTTMFLPNVSTSVGLLCPDQRRMPQLGSLVAEIIVMPILILRLPVVIIVSSPVLVDLLAGPCFLDSKGHSLLMNCGQELFSLEDFFASAYACNTYFWNILAMVANFLAPGFAQTLLNGMATAGENSFAAFVPGIMGIMSKVTANSPLDTLTTIQGGGGRFGPASMFMQTALNPIAGTHWFWRTGSRTVVQIIQASRAQRSVASVIWNVIYDARLDYKALVARCMFNTCGGLALMAGYGSPMGNTLQHYCFAGVESTMATLDLVSIFTVDLPLVACVCRRSVGSNQADWILRNCEAPDSLKPLLRTLMDDPEQCATLVAQTDDKLTGVFNATFGELFAGTTSVGSILDSFMAAIDNSNGDQCDNYESNPYVVTLIPEPADYWRVCGQTDFCRLRCQQQMDAFEAVRPDTVRSTTTVNTIQSLFFPTLNQNAGNPFDSVAALSELASCASLCPDAEDRCFLTTGFTNNLLRVAQYCVPSALAIGVSKQGQWDTYGISGQSVQVQFIRIAVTSGWQDAYGVVGIQDQVLQACLRLVCAEFAPSDVDVGVLGFQQMQIIDNVAILQVRTSVSGTASYCMRYQGQWTFFACDGTNIWDQGLYHVVYTTKGELLLLPFDDVPMQICQLNQASMAAVQCTQYAGFQRQNVPVKTRGKQSRVSQLLAVDYSVFIVSNAPNNWLTMLSVFTTDVFASAMVSNSMPVTMQYTLQQGCSLDSCVGCTQLAVQRLCFAAQQCQVARCVGSQVNQLRPLCAIGGVAEAQLFSLLAAAQGVWSIISSTLTDVVDITGGIVPPKTIKWPDQAFYGLICSMKDIIAAQVSILTSAVNGLMQASMPVTMLAHGDAVDNSFLATFTLTMMSVTKFLYQLALGPLYAAIGMQKIIVCETNSLIGVISGNNAVTIGDPAIQSATSSSTGVCMSQVHTENAQGLNSGMDSNSAFASGASQILSNLAKLSFTLPLETLVHPLDVSFTYVLGVIAGLQDVLQTADQKK